MSFIPSVKWFLRQTRRSGKRVIARRIDAQRLWRTLGLELLEDRVNPAPIPTVSLFPSTTTLIGNTVAMSTTFTNTGDTTGYGPFVDIELPTAGNVPASNNGLSYVSGSATYLGAVIQTQVFTFDASGHVTHPFLVSSSGAPVVITGIPGDELLVFSLPLGSFTPGQSAATIDFSAQLSSLATISVPLNVTATGGFEYGADPLNNPTVDPPIVGSNATSSVTPTLYQVKKTYLGSEQETVTGPNFVQQYQISVQAAPGQTINNFNLSDALPDNMQYVSMISASANGSSTSSLIQSPSTTTPGGTIVELFNKVVGTGSATDATLVFSFYVPELDASDNSVLAPNTGDNASVTDTATAGGIYVPLTGSGNTTGPVSQSSSNTITAKQIATQKTVQDITSASPTRGDTLKYTINFQVSDFFALQNLIATDILSDGQSFNLAFTPTINIAQHGIPLSGIFMPGTFNETRDTMTTGDTTVVFDVSQALALQGLATGSDVFGGDVPAPGDTGGVPFGGTTGTITFEAKIDNEFMVQPSPNSPVVPGDQFSDNLSISSAVLNNSTLATTGNTASDSSSASISIPRGVFTKTVYAVNGIIGAPVSAVTVGDLVTYELNFTLPQTNVQNYHLTDYLPLPIFTASPMSFVVGAPSIPVVNTATFGPHDTFYSASGIAPTISANATTNSLDFNFGDYSDSSSLTDLVSDVLFTVQVSDTPFTDGLSLSNLAVASEGSNNGGTYSASNLAQIKLSEPKLVITKGVVSTNDTGATFTSTPTPSGVTFAAPGTIFAPPFAGLINSAGLAATPITASLKDAQEGDLVRFAEVVENRGSGREGAFNVTISDAFPISPIPNYTLVAGSLQVDNGAGVAIAYTGNLLTGIILTDPSGSQGSLTAGVDSSGILNSTGTNIVVITYDVQFDTNVENNVTFVNTATMSNYSSAPGGPNFVPQGQTAQAQVTTATIVVAKSLVSTSIENSNNSATQVVIGERVDYSITLTVNSITAAGIILTDNLASIGMAYANDKPIQINAPSVSYSGSGIPVVSNNGQLLTINFGTISNTSGQPKQITVTFETVVLNVGTNTDGTRLINAAILQTANGTTTSTAPAVTVIEPKLITTKSVSISGGGTAQGGSTVTYTITIAQNTASDADAYNAIVSDAMPLLTGGGSVILLPTFTIADTLGLVTNANFQLTGNSTTGYLLTTTSSGQFDLLKSQTGRLITITINGTVTSGVTAGETIDNTDNIQWTSLPNIATIPSNNPNSTVRTGTGRPALNNYFGAATASFAINNAQVVKALLGTSINNVNNGQAQAVIGEQVEYQVTLTIPDGIVPSASLVDQLPAGLAFVRLVSFTISDPTELTLTGNPSNPIITNNGQTVTFNLGTIVNASTNIGVAQALTFDYDAVVLNVAENVTGTTLRNSAELFWNSGDSHSNTASAASVAIIEPRVLTTKSVNDLTSSGYFPGDTVSYTITIQQANTVDANNVTLTDHLPQFTGGGSILLSPTFTVFDPVGQSVSAANFQLTGNNATGWTLSTNSSDPIALTTTRANRVVSIIVTGKLSANVQPGFSFTNTDEIEWTSLPGTNPGQISSYNTNSTVRTGSATPAVNNYTASASAVATVSPYLDLAITKTVSNPYPSIGDLDTFTIVLTNNGPSDGTGIVVNDPLQPGLIFVHSTPAPGTSYDPATGVWTVGNLASGASVTLDVLVLNTTSTLKTNTATVTGAVHNINTNNNSASASVESLVDLAVVKTVDDPYPIVGQFITYTVTVINHGPAIATNVVVSDTLPSGLTYSSSQPSEGSYDPTTGVWTVGTMLVNTPETLQITLLVTGYSVGINTVSVSHIDQPDSNSSNNSASVTESPQTSSLAGSVYIDSNNNAMRDPGEIGVPGVAVVLTGTDYAGRTVTATVITDANGNYVFYGLVKGTYTLTEIQPPNLLDGRDMEGTVGGSAGNDVITNIGINAPVAGTSYEFGELGLKNPTKFNFLASTDPSQLFGAPGSGVVGVASASSPIRVAAASVISNQKPLNVYNLNGTLRFQVQCFDPGFTGQVNVAIGDVSGDGNDDVIVAAGAGGGPEVKVFNGVDGSLTSAFFAFPEQFRGGAYVTLADTGKSGMNQIIVSAGAGGGPVVAIFDGRNGYEYASFMAYDINMTAGVRVISIDLTGNGQDDLVTVPGPGAGSEIRVFDGNGGGLIAQFFAFSAEFLGGVSISAASIGGQPRIIVGSGPGLPAQVQVLDIIGNQLQSFQPPVPQSTAGVGIGTRYNGTHWVIGVTQGSDIHEYDALTGLKLD